MKTMTLDEDLAQVAERKRSLGITDGPREIELMRNKGGQRTQAKRELLGRAAKRASDAGQKPVPSYY
jgi:hypothetical protein